MYLVFGPLFVFLAIAWNVELLINNVPDHWCYHPMTDGLNESELALWKMCYLPNAAVNKSCNIYVPSTENENEFWNQTSFNGCPWPNRSLPSSEASRESSSCKKEWKQTEMK